MFAERQQSEARTALVALKVTPSERKAIVRAAKRERVTVSDYVRRLLRQALEGCGGP